MYARRIQKLERQLGIKITDFSNWGIDWLFVTTVKHRKIGIDVLTISTIILQLLILSFLLTGSIEGDKEHLQSSQNSSLRKMFQLN
jgi:hypothetical protein